MTNRDERRGRAHPFPLPTADCRPPTGTLAALYHTGRCAICPGTTTALGAASNSRVGCHTRKSCAHPKPCRGRAMPRPSAPSRDPSSRAGGGNGGVAAVFFLGSAYRSLCRRRYAPAAPATRYYPLLPTHGPLTAQPAYRPSRTRARRSRSSSTRSGRPGSSARPSAAHGAHSASGTLAVDGAMRSRSRPTQASSARHWSAWWAISAMALSIPAGLATPEPGAYWSRRRVSFSR